MEQTIGTTELRQRLTDVLLAVREEQATYVVATFERSQAVIVNLDEYRQFQQYKSEREAFFEWLDDAARQNSELNQGLSDEDILALIEQARNEVAAQVD